MVPFRQFLVAGLHRVQRGRPGQAQASPAVRAVRAGVSLRRRGRSAGVDAASWPGCAAGRAAPPPPRRRSRGGRAARTGAARRCRRAAAPRSPPGTCLCSSPRSCCRRARAPGRTTSSRCRFAAGLGRAVFAGRAAAGHVAAPARRGRVGRVGPGSRGYGASWCELCATGGGLATGVTRERICVPCSRNTVPFPRRPAGSRP